LFYVWCFPLIGDYQAGDLDTLVTVSTSKMCCALCSTV